MELPSNLTAITASLVDNAAGTNQTRFIVLVTAEEMDETAEAGLAGMATYRHPDPAMFAAQEMIFVYVDAQQYERKVFRASDSRWFGAIVRIDLSVSSSRWN